MGVKHVLMAGAGCVEITPELGVHLAGDVGAHRPAEGILDPLSARALVLSDGCHKVCFVSADLTIIAKPEAERIRQAATELGFEHDAVMVHATQTHSAPALGRFMLDDEFHGVPAGLDWLHGDDPSYRGLAVERIVEAVRRALAALSPVQFAAGRTIEGRIAFNRRGIARDGSAFMPGRRWPQPLGPVNLCYLEGPIDPEVGVAAFRGPEGHLLAFLLHYTCHPVNVFPRREVSADWPGAWCRHVEAAVGPGCVPIVANGCCGNINPWDPFDPDYRDDHERMGRLLAEGTAKVLETLQFGDAAPVAFASRHVPIPIRAAEPAALDDARRFLNEHPDVLWADAARTRVDWRWFRAANLVSVDLQRRREALLDYEVQAFRVGDLALVGLPGEPFVEGQLRVKMASPAKWTFVAHCANQYVGYVPIREAFASGGHELNLSTWAKLAPEALDMVVAAAGQLLHGLFRQSG